MHFGEVSQQGETDQSKLLLYLCGLSVVVHLGFFMVDPSFLTQHRAPMIEEWEIGADILTDVEVMSPKSALPQAKKSEKTEVPDNILPQLPKRFSVKEKQQPEQTEGGTIIEPGKGQEETKSKLAVKKDDNANELEALDAIKRLALERLRRMQKVESDSRKAPEKNELAQLKDELAKKGIGSNGAALHSKEVAGYQGILTKAIRRNWSLPDAYNLKDAQLEAIVQLVLNEGGGLIKAELSKPSGDQAFDTLAVQAVKNSIPLPRPPRSLVGMPIPIRFSPQTF